MIGGQRSKKMFPLICRTIIGRAGIVIKKRPTRCTQQLTCPHLDLDASWYVNTPRRPNSILTAAHRHVTIACHLPQRKFMNLKKELNRLLLKRVCQRSEISHESVRITRHITMTCYVLNLDRLSCSFRWKMTDGFVSNVQLRRFGTEPRAITIGIEMRRTTELWCMYRRRIYDDYRFHMAVRLVICVGLHCVLFKFASKCSVVIIISVKSVFQRCGERTLSLARAFDSCQG